MELLVTKKIFARAIAAYCFEKKVNFDPLSSKTQVAAILKAQLRWHGQSGLYMEHWDAATEEFWRPYREGYLKASEWISKNYPYLK